jgi:hypothetical protein
MFSSLKQKLDPKYSDDYLGQIKFSLNVNTVHFDFDFFLILNLKKKEEH